MKKCFAITVLLSVCIIAQSQKTTHVLRYTSYADFFRTPSVYLESQFSSPTYEYAQGFSYFTVIYDVKYNVYEPNEEWALSAGLMPTIGAYVMPDTYDPGVGGYSIPALLSLNFGAGSTYESTKGFGLGLGIGYQFKQVGLIGGNNFADFDSDTKIPVSWSQPVAAFNVRWWGGGDMLNELSFRAGLPVDGKDLEPIDSLEPSKAFHFQISYGRFINY